MPARACCMVAPATPTGRSHGGDRRHDREGHGGQGAEGGSARLHLERRHRRRIDRPRLQPRGEPRPRGGNRRPAGARDHAARVRADALHRLVLLLPEPGRSRLRHHVLVGDARDGAAHGLDGRLGNHRRRRDRDGQPGPDRRPVHVLPGRSRQPREQQVVVARPGRALDRGHDLDLLRGHRGVGQDAVVPARRRGDHPRHLRAGGAPQGVLPATRPGRSTRRCPGSTRSTSRAVERSPTGSLSRCSSTGAGTAP